MVAHAVLAAHALAPAAHQSVGALAVQDDTGEVLTALFADALLGMDTTENDQLVSSSVRKSDLKRFYTFKQDSLPHGFNSAP